MTSKQITDLIQAAEYIPGSEAETRRILEICEALNARIDELAALTIRSVNQKLAEPHTPIASDKKFVHVYDAARAVIAARHNRDDGWDRWDRLKNAIAELEGAVEQLEQ